MAEKRIKGITIEIGGDTKKLSEALKDVNKTINSTNTELKDLQKALKLDPKNTELLAQKQELLEKQIKATNERLSTLKETQRQLGEYNQLTDEQKENYRALSVEIAKAEGSLKNLKNELKESNKYSLDNLNNSLKGIRDITTDLVKDMAKITAGIIGTLSALGMSSIKSYAEYEQLVGGVEAMFGGMEKGAQEITKVQKTAMGAWKDLTMSQNDYYKMFTSTYPLVKSSIDDQNEAIDVTNRLLRLNSDLSNTFGYDIETAATAVNWALKGSFNYIDNLNIGIKGTKEGFLDAARNCGYMVDNVNELSSSDILDVLEQYANKYGVLGRTADEASNTIQGSTKMLKASWGNLKLAISDDTADMDKAIDDFVDSAITAGQNIVPRIRTAIDGIKKLFNSIVRDVFPRLKREIPELKPLINVFEWFIDHKSLVITALKAIIAAFAVTKIVEFATSVKNAFNSLMSFATGGVAGAITTAIGAVVSVVTILSNIWNTETEAQREARLEMERHTDELNSQMDSWTSLQEAQQKQINQGMTEISYYEDLYDELRQITDENGKVQEGYEKRAEFITSQLKDALGIEIEYTDGVIENYNDISEAIDKVIEKKKAEVIMSAQSGAYGEAKANEAAAIQDLIYWQQQEAGWREIVNKAYEEGNMTVYRLAKEQYDAVKESYDKQQEVVDNYQHTIAQYEQNLVYMHEEAYDKIDTKTWEFVKSYKNANDTQREELEKTIEAEEKDLELWQKKYEETGDEMYKTQVDSVKRSLDKHKEDLNQYISAINNKQDDMETAGENFIQGLTNGVNNKKGGLFTSISNIGLGMLSKLKSALKEKSPSKATEEMGEYLVEGLMLGIKGNQNALLNQVDSLGNSVIGGLYDNTMAAMSGLNNSISTSLNPTINPSVAYELNYKVMANAMKDALQEVDVELDDRKVGKFINKTVSEEVFN